jgi:hypothetical protein
MVRSAISLGKSLPYADLSRYSHSRFAMMLFHVYTILLGAY